MKINKQIVLSFLIGVIISGLVVGIAVPKLKPLFSSADVTPACASYIDVVRDIVSEIENANPPMDLEQYNEAVSRIQAQLTSYIACWTQVCSPYYESLDELQGQANTLNEEWGSVLSQLESVDQQIEQLTNYIYEMEQTFPNPRTISQQQQLNQLNGQLTDLLNQYGVLQNRSDAITVEWNNLLDEISQLNQTIEDNLCIFLDETDLPELPQPPGEPGGSGSDKGIEPGSY